MAYTEVKMRNGKRYYYRTVSIRKNKRVAKQRIYLGSALQPLVLASREEAADSLFASARAGQRLKPLIRRILPILKKYHVKKASIFGSYARGENKKGSDVDILIEPPKEMGLAFVGLALELEQRLRRKVDLVTYGGMSPYLKRSILEDERKIL